MILDRLAVKDSPEWMKNLELDKDVPLKRILQGSLFYPCSALHGEPIFTWRHHIQSFVYSDIRTTLDEARDSLRHPTHGVKGYVVRQERELAIFESENELEHLDPWEPDFSADHRDRRADLFGAERGENRFGIFKLERKPEFGERHGPETLLFAFASADSTKAYKRLYCDNRVSARVIAIVQPGPGPFRDQDSEFGNAVLKNPYGMPKYLMCGGSGTQDFKACWPLYSRLLLYWTSSTRWKAGVWKRG